MVPPAIEARALPGPPSREGRRELGVPAGSAEIHPKVPSGRPASLADDSNSPEGEARGGAALSSPAVSTLCSPAATVLAAAASAITAAAASAIHADAAHFTSRPRILLGRGG